MKGNSIRTGCLLVAFCVTEWGWVETFYGQQAQGSHTLPSASAEIKEQAQWALLASKLAEKVSVEQLPARPEINLPVVHTEVVTTARVRDGLWSEPSAFTSSVEEIRSTAGSYSDVPRYLQVLPGVAFDSDARNTFLVRGGNPTENLFVVNGIEVPNINQLSTLNSTAGFVSMIDTEALSQITLNAGSYSSSYSERLSSVLHMQTQEVEGGRSQGKINFGYAGVSGIWSQPLGDRGGIKTAFRRSLMDQFTDDIGMNGVPKYQSVLSALRFRLSESDRVSGIFLGGTDSMDIRPNIRDGEDPGFINTSHKGSNYTVGIIWQHIFSPRFFSDFTVTSAYQHTNDFQTDALKKNAFVAASNMTEQISSARYDAFFAARNSFNLRFGSKLEFARIRYNVDQSGGYPNPYKVDPKPMDAFSFVPDLLAVNQAFYGEAMWSPKPVLQFIFGGRYQRWGINGASSVNPHLGVRVRLTEAAYLFGSYKQNSQLPGYPFLLATDTNRSLVPIQSRNIEAGVGLQRRAGDRVTLTYFVKQYENYPVATEYSELSMANVIDTFAAPFLYMPLVSAGKGRASGIEVSAESSSRRAAFLKASFTAASTQYTALDGVWRRGNYDYPYMGTLLAGYRIGDKYNFSLRYSAHAGGPYTPFLLQASKKQARPIYDLSKVNSASAPSYARVDARVERTFQFNRSSLKLYGGVLNLLDKKNFYQQVFVSNSRTLYDLTQMGRYSDAGIIYSF